MARLYLIIIMIVLSYSLFGEVFLIGDLAKNAHTLSLQNASFAENENQNSVSLNQAILAKVEGTHAQVSYMTLFEDVSLTNITLLTDHRSWNGLKYGLNFSYIDYGDFDDIKNPSQVRTFSATDYSIGCLVASSLRKDLDWGAELKYISGSIDDYSSSALLVNATLLYKSSFQDINLALGVANAGFQLNEYASTSEKLPTSFKIGASKKLDNAPLKFFSSYSYYLEDYDYYSFGVEMLLKSRLRIRGSYDFTGKDKEIGTNSEGEKFAGLAVGAGLAFELFTLDFGYKINGNLKENLAFSLSKSF